MVASTFRGTSRYLEVSKVSITPNSSSAKGKWRKSSWLVEKRLTHRVTDSSRAQTNGNAAELRRKGRVPGRLLPHSTSLLARGPNKVSVVRLLTSVLKFWARRNCSCFTSWFNHRHSIILKCSYFTELRLTELRSCSFSKVKESNSRKTGNSRVV